MTKTIHISVTVEHLLNGVKGSCSRCPIALAIRDALGPGRTWIGGNWTHITLKQNFFGHQFPPEVITFIKDFDDGKEVLPFETDLVATIQEGDLTA